MTKLNPEDIFLLQWQKIHTSISPVPNNFLRKNLYNNADNLSYTLHHSKINNFDIIPAINYVLKDIELRNLSNMSISALTYVARFCLEEENNKLTDMDLKGIATAKVSTYQSKKLDHIQLQLKVSKLIKDDYIKIETFKKIFENILAISNDSKNQAFILRQWLKLKRDPMDIAEYIPLMVSQNPTIEFKKQEFNTVMIDANKLSNQFRVASFHTHNFSTSFLKKFKEKYPDAIFYSEENKAKCNSLILLKETGDADLLVMSFEYFIQKIATTGKWKDIEFINKTLLDGWDNVFLANKLENDLSVNSNVTKKLKL